MAKTKNIQFDTMSLHGIDEDAELIPLMTPEDEEEINNEKLPETLPILPYRWSWSNRSKGKSSSPLPPFHA